MARDENVVGGKRGEAGRYHQDDVLWGKGITHMVARAVAATERD